MFAIARGESRIVLLIGRFAAKFPRLHRCDRCYPSCFSRFLFGLYANRVEADRWRRADETQRSSLARVLFGGALVLVMERCLPVDRSLSITAADWSGIVAMSELSHENFGVTRDGRVVALDYAFW